MTAPLFFVDPADLDTSLSTGRVVLAGPEGRHAARVRRMRVGERVDVADGAGRRAECVVSTVQREGLELTVRRHLTEPAPALRLVVVQALAKGDRAEQAVEALTEVGADVLVPWAASRSIVHWRGGRGERALARWRESARQAAKQARRARLPEVTECASTDDVAARLRAAALGLLLHEDADARLTDVAVPDNGDVVVVVGPEGGLSHEEVTELEAAGGSPVRMGPTVLRTSTAGVVAAGVLLARSQRWS